MCYAAKIAEEKGDDAILHRIHYLRPSFDQIFSFDPFRFPDVEIPPKNKRMAEASWLHAASDRIMRAMLRRYTEADIEIMVRLLRWLKNLLTAVGTGVPDKQHLSLADIQVLLNKRHKRHDEVFKALHSHMPQDILADFERLHSIDRVQDEDHYTESTDNRLRTFLSPLVQAIFATDAPSIDFKHIIENHQILLVNLAESDFFSREQGLQIAGLVINEMITTVSRTRKEQRTPHHLIIDEAGYYVAEDMERLLTEARKWRLSLCLGGQSLRTFMKGDVDLFEVIADNCSMFISFKQRNVKTVQQLGKFFAYPNRILAERMDVRDRPDGYVVVPIIDRSVSVTDITSNALSEAHSDSRATGIGLYKGKTSSEAESDGKTQGIHAGKNESEGQSSFHTNQSGNSMNQTSNFTPVMQDGAMHMIPVPGSSAGNFMSSGNGRGEMVGKGHSFGLSALDSHTKTKATADSKGVGLQLQIGESDTVGSTHMKGKAKSKSATLKHTPLAVTREELHPTGQPRLALPFQDAIHETVLTTLPDRYALVRIAGQGAEKTVIFRTHDVNDPYDDPYIRRQKLEEFKARVVELQPYIVQNPALPEDEQNERLDAFLRQFESDENQRPMSDENFPLD